MSDSWIFSSEEPHEHPSARFTRAHLHPPLFWILRLLFFFNSHRLLPAACLRHFPGALTSLLSPLPHSSTLPPFLPSSPPPPVSGIRHRFAAAEEATVVILGLNFKKSLKRLHSLRCYLRWGGGNAHTSPSHLPLSPLPRYFTSLNLLLLYQH